VVSVRHKVAVRFEDGQGSVSVNGVDVSGMTERVEVTLDSRGMAVVRLDLTPDAVTLDLDGVEVYAETLITP
jgi:hypothetical protein